MLLDALLTCNESAEFNVPFHT